MIRRKSGRPGRSASPVYHATATRTFVVKDLQRAAYGNQVAEDMTVIGATLAGWSGSAAATPCWPTGKDCS